MGASLKVHNLVNFDDQREDLAGGRSAWAAGSGRRRPMGLVASSAVGGTTKGRPGGERTGLADFVSLGLKDQTHRTSFSRALRYVSYARFFIAIITRHFWRNR